MTLFRSSRLKVERAKKHIGEFNSAVSVFRKLDPYRVVIDRDPNSGNQLLRVIARNPIPDDWPLMVGDAIHNLRAALDLLACDVMRLHGRGVASVHFPFAEDAEDLEAVLVKRTVHRARPNIVNLFRELEPYQGGVNELLRPIHDLDVKDKHKLINPVVDIAEMPFPRVFFHDGSVMIDPAPGATLAVNRDGRVLISFPPNCRFQYETKVPFEILFGEGPIKTKPVLPTLAQMVKLVSEIIDRFERRITQAAPPILLEYHP